MKIIPFNKPIVPAGIDEYLGKVFTSRRFSGDGEQTKACHSFLIQQCKSASALLTTSCTHGLEMTGILLDIKEGDEIIMPSFTFVSTANAYILRGAKVVFIDVDPRTMNIDANLIEPAITSKTRAIVVMHYGGVACDMNQIMNIAKKHNLAVIEDAAQALGAYYNNQPLGGIGEFGTLSFHETKNVHCGEGGAILINDEKYAERAEIIREKGTNRAKFFRGMVDKYSWVDVGSSYLPSELNAAFLMPQFNMLDVITKRRVAIWDIYYSRLRALADVGHITLPFVPDGCKHNGHIFYIKCRDINERTSLIDHLKANGIYTVFHYVPLHSSVAGAKYSRFHGDDRFTTSESERLVRLPLYFDMTDDDALACCEGVLNFYGKK